jgi:hypothetical protein
MPPLILVGIGGLTPQGWKITVITLIRRFVEIPFTITIFRYIITASEFSA